MAVRVVCAAEEVVGGDVEVIGELDEKLKRRLALTIFVTLIGFRKNFEVFSNNFLGQTFDITGIFKSFSKHNYTT